MIPTPRMKTDIRRRSLFAIVEITDPAGRSLLTTLDRQVQAGDRCIDNLKRQLAHLPPIKDAV